jgi:hypothetical protein
LPSGADEARVEGTCEADVGGSLHDGAAVSEEGKGVRAAAEAEEKVVGAEGVNFGMGLEAGFEGCEVDGAMVLVNLDGVAPAEGYVRTAFSG